MNESTKEQRMPANPPPQPTQTLAKRDDERRDAAKRDEKRDEKPEEATAEQDAAAVDSRVPSSGASNVERRTAAEDTPDALLTPPHIAKGGDSDTYPTGNPALAAQVWSENQAARAAAGTGDPPGFRAEFLQSHRLGVTPESEARAVRQDTDAERKEAEAEAKQMRERRLGRLAELKETIDRAVS